MLQVTSEDALAVKVFTAVPFFWIVKVALLTVGMVGLLVKSLYEPEKDEVPAPIFVRACAFWSLLRDCEAA